MPTSQQPRRSPRERKPRRADVLSDSEGLKGYTTREVGDVLGLPNSTILSWTRRGLISPDRGPGGSYVFSFQDIVLLRTARELLEANVPPRRVRDTLEALRSQLPAGRPLSAVTISALGNRVLVQDEAGVWEPDSGQLQIDFSVAEASPATLSICRGGRSRSVPDAHDPDRCADDWYDAGLDLEVSSHSEAIAAYERALALDPNHSDAHLNLGRLLHEGGRIQEAEDHYRAAARSDPQSARARYNLGVALEDQGKGTAAVDAYRGALTLDPNLAVAHFNLSRLFEADGRRSDALGHLVAYKRLIEGRAEGA